MSKRPIEDGEALVYLITKDREVQKTTLNLKDNKIRLACPKCYSSNWTVVYVDGITELITFCNKCPRYNKEMAH